MICVCGHHYNVHAVLDDGRCLEGSYDFIEHTDVPCTCASFEDAPESTTTNLTSEEN